MKKHIYIYSPSSAVRDKAAFQRGVRYLRSIGHEVELDVFALRSQQRFAGDDQTRLDAIHRAAASGADVAMISRGGYGITRILPALKLKLIAKAIERGTQFVGLSDFTALQCALLEKTGAPTWAGPALGEDFGAADVPDEVMVACFEDMVSGQGEGTGWRLATAQGDQLIERAPLWGGNLSMLVSLLGTPYFPQIKGGVLFLEDVNEHPYRIERMLSQLQFAGVIQRQKAIILGQFSNYRLSPHDRGFKLETVIERLRAQTTVPVLTGLPFGHVATKVLLPVGQKVALAVEGRDAFLLWGHGH